MVLVPSLPIRREAWRMIIWIQCLVVRRRDLDWQGHRAGKRHQESAPRRSLRCRDERRCC